MDNHAPSVPAEGPLTGGVRIDKEIYSVYYADPGLLRHMPNPEQASSPSTDSIYGNFHGPTYISTITPYLIFIPAHDPWHGPLLGRLRYTLDTIPVVEVSKYQWGLPPAVIDEWRALELNLIAVVYALMECSKHHRPQNLAPFGFPYRFGYLQTYRTSRLAWRVAQRSIDGFLPLLGHISMFIFFMRLSEKVEGLSEWRSQVCHKAGVHMGWFAALENSAVGDFTSPRIGGILDLRPPPGPHDISDPTPLDFMIGSIIATKLPIPLYMRWGQIDSSPNIAVPITLTGMHFVPDFPEVAYLKRMPGRVAFSVWVRTRHAEKTIFSTCRDSNPFVLAAPVPPSNPQRIPFPVEPYSGQDSGETMREFFERRRKSNANRLAHESPDQTQRRLQREAHAAKGDVPGKKGACVFVWELSNGEYIRHAAGRANYEDVWDTTEPDQRVYDSFHNEWDVCEIFGDSEGQQDTRPIAAEGDDDEDDIPMEMLPEYMQVKRDGQQTSEADFDRIYCTVHPVPDAPQYPVPGPDVEAMVYRRFGCILSSDMVPATGLTLPNKTVIAKVLGDKNIELPEAPKLHNLGVFLACCKDAQTLAEIPSQLLDFHRHTSRIYQSWEVDVEQVEFNHGLRYVLRETDSPGPLYILLQSATTVLEIIRQSWGPDIGTIAQHLLWRGIPFNLCILLAKPPPAPSTSTLTARHLYSGLGYRHQNYKFDVRDYRAYVDLRTRFLQTCRGRVALRSGGIVARMAQDIVSADDALLGPSNDMDHGKIFLTRGEQSYWDDSLTEDEIDLICGVYHIATGQRDPNKLGGRQVTTQSWWPRPSVFGGSPLNVGWWTPACEHFYGNRLKMITEKTAQPLTQEEWKNNLKLEKKCKPYLEGIERCASNILRGLRPSLS